MGIQKIAKINSGSVKKRFGVVVELNVLAVLSSPKSVVGDPEVTARIPANHPRE
jgi:hypothetical protein